MQNDMKDATPESLSAHQFETFKLNQQLVEERTAEIIAQLQQEGISRSQLLDGDDGRERLREIIWEDPAPLSLLERCQVIMDVLHNIAAKPIPDTSNVI